MSRKSIGKSESTRGYLEHSPQSPGLQPIQKHSGLLRLIARDVHGILLLAFALMTLFALLQITEGVVLTWWARALRVLFGWGSAFVVLVLIVVGVALLRRRESTRRPIRWGQVLMLELAGFLVLALFTLSGGASVQRAAAGQDGGLVGWGLVELLRFLIKPAWLLSMVLSLTLLICLIYGLGLARPMMNILNKWLASAMKTETSAPQKQEAADTISPPSVTERRTLPRLPGEQRKRFVLRLEEKPSGSPQRDERLPPLDLLSNEQAVRPDERNINLTAGLIEKTLAEFGIPAKVVGYRIGPTVTQFAVEPGYIEKAINNPEEEIVRQKVRVSQISALARDLALALSAERLRIEAPVPGRPYVGIEVPHARSALVRLRPILENEAFYKYGSPLTIALGKDVSGQAVVADLARMPHLLIAGTTGSGKSVCIAALTTCLVMNNTPEDLRLVMIDPKMVELVRFNGLPHLYGKVETELERILCVLRWATVEMDRRYRLLESFRARDIDAYNRRARRRQGELPLPRIVIMIDELADLMMSAPEQTEHSLVRLAQMGRATGIHLVVATQRPSTDVVTGLIKANFPARISFAVASSVDSRIILDTVGAETLLGNGDMLFLPPEASTPVRVQGIMVTDQEIEQVVTFWQKARAGEEVSPAPWEEMIRQEAMLAEKDHLISKAIEIVRQEQQASASLLQRRLRIGYPRAARLIDELEEMGIVGPPQGGGRERQVLIGPDDKIPI